MSPASEVHACARMRHRFQDENLPKAQSRVVPGYGAYDDFEKERTQLPFQSSPCPVSLGTDNCRKTMLQALSACQMMLCSLCARHPALTASPELALQDGSGSTGSPSASRLGTGLDFPFTCEMLFDQAAGPCRGRRCSR